MKIIKSKYGSLYLRKEKGNLYRKNENGESKPIMYQMYANEMEPLALWDYINIRGIDLVSASIELNELKVPLLTNTFDLAFYDEKSANEVIKLLENF